MRIRLGVFLFLLAVPIAGYGQVAGSMLNFPRAFPASELGSTGFAIVNPGATDAPVIFTMYSASGATLGTTSRTVTARGQMSALGSGLFPSVTQAGWIQAVSASIGLQGFWLGGDWLGTPTFTDGAEAAAESLTLIFTLVAPQMEVNVANLGAATNSLTFRLYGTAGTEMATATRSIPVGGIVSETAAALFPSANLNNATHIRVEGSGNIAGTTVSTGYVVTPSWAVVNGVSATSTVTEANFPHVVSGVGFGGDWTTVLGAMNLSTSSQTVTITFTPTLPANTAPLTRTRTIAVNGSFRETAKDLFGTGTDYYDGWVKISGTAALTGFVAYSDAVKNSLAVVSVQASARTQLLFAHLANGAPWITGLALLNASSSNANVEVYAMNPNGSLIGGAANATNARFTLNAGAKSVRLLDGFIPQSTGKQAGFIYIRTTNNVPIYGAELFFTQDLSVLANVAAGSIATGITFVIPDPDQPLTLTSLSASSIARNASLRLTGTGFSTSASQNTVVFTSATGTVNGTVTASTTTTIDGTVPATAITGPVLVQEGGETSSSLIVTVTATSSTLVQSPVTVSSGASSTGVDIYVTGTNSLNVTALAILDVGFTGSVGLGGSSVEVTRGQTKDLVLSGAGMSASSTVAISGTGVTVSNIRFVSNLLIAQIAVSATADLGNRNIVVTNSNLDTTVFTGGLFIR